MIICTSVIEVFSIAIILGQIATYMQFVTHYFFCISVCCIHTKPPDKLVFACIGNSQILTQSKLSQSEKFCHAFATVSWAVNTSYNFVLVGVTAGQYY